MSYRAISDKVIAPNFGEYYINYVFVATCVCEPNFHGAICDIADDVIPSTRPVDYEPGERTIYCDTR